MHACIRIAIEREIRELTAQEADTLAELCMTQTDKEAMVKEARRRGALRNPLTHYAGKVRSPHSFDIDGDRHG